VSEETLTKASGTNILAEAPELKAAIWKIDRFAIHDGPGIRTNIYFKGCSLRCLWCSNPEGQLQNEEIGLSETQCTKCGLCYAACSRRALKSQNGFPVMESAKCDFCGQCVSVCPAGAIHIYGGFYSLPQLMDIVERDRHIYRRSGGGITCTGGEPFLQAEFLRRLLAQCHEVGIHTAVETCGCVDESEFKESMANIDWLFFDLKHIGSGEHQRLTGRDNKTILNNLRLASSVLGGQGKVLVIRQVVITGVNDENNILALAELARGLPHLDYIELLPYHNYGMNKYQILGRKYQLRDMLPPSEAKVKGYQQIIEDCGLTAKIGGL
jgi:pyruvate formate lyase activating enzyme